MAGGSWRRYFEFSLTEKNQNNGLCKLCNRTYKDKYGIFSNFLKHLKRLHPDEYARTFNTQDEISSEEKRVGEDSATSLELTNAKERHNRITISIAKNLIVRCNLPFSLVESAGFRDFAKDCILKYEPVSSKKLKRDIIPSFTNNVLKIIHETLNDVKYLTLTIDGWSDRRCRSFLGITCHFIDDKMLPRSYLIGFVRLKSPHTGENVKRLTEDVLDRYDIKDKVFKIITDNASSMIKAYKFGLIGDEETDQYYDTSNLMSNGLQTFEDDDDDDIELNDFHMINVDYDGDFDDCENLSTVRLSCFAHTVQLCVRDGLKNSSYMSKVLSKCKLLSKFSHKSSKMSDLLDELNKHINKMNVTRWNSEYLLVKSVLSIEKNDLESITKLMDNSIQFSNNDLMILQEITNILEPFYEISIKCQQETIVSASLVVPAVVHLLTHLRDGKENVSYCTKLVNQLQSSIELRFAGIVKRLNQCDIEISDPFNDPIYFIATVLDPSFKFYWLRDLKLPANSENRLKQNIIQLILDDISKDTTMAPKDLFNQKIEQNSSSSSSSSLSSSSLSSSSLSSSSLSSSTPKPKRRKLFDYSDNNSDDSNDSTQMDTAEELEFYLNDPVKFKFSDYWFSSRLTTLKKTVARIFSVQASSAPVERVFSQARLVLSSRRTKMNEQLFRDLIFLRVNQHLL